MWCAFEHIIHWELAHNKSYIIFIIVIIIIFIIIIVIIIITIIICLELFWTAPEFLGEDADLPFSQPGDVYSYGIILSELLSREMPYFSYNMSPKGRFFSTITFLSVYDFSKVWCCFSFHSLLSNSLTTDRTSVEYFTRTCSDWLTWRWRTNYSLLVRLVSPKIVSFKRSQMIELESLTPFFLFRYYQPSTKTAYSSIQTWISDWHSG